MITAGKLNERVAFDAPDGTSDGAGGVVPGWTTGETIWAEFRYQRGTEAVKAGGLTGTATFKVRVRSTPNTRDISAEYRMRDTRRNVAYNVREVDAITDRDSVWIIVETGVAI